MTTSLGWIWIGKGLRQQQKTEHMAMDSLTYETRERDLVFSLNRKRIHFLSGFNLYVSNLVSRELSGFPAWVVEKSSLKLRHARIAFSRERVYPFVL